MACPRALRCFASAALRQPHVPASEWKTRMSLATGSVFPSPHGPETTQVLSPSFSLSPFLCLELRPSSVSPRIHCSPHHHQYPPSHFCPWRSPGHPGGHAERPAHAAPLKGPTALGGGAVGLPVVFQPSPIRSAVSPVPASASAPLPCLLVWPAFH